MSLPFTVVARSARTALAATATVGQRALHPLVRRWIQDEVDGENGSVRHAAVQSHLGACATCRAEFEGLLYIDQLLTAGDTSVEPSANLADSVMATVLSCRQSAEASERFVPRWRATIRRTSLPVSLMGALAQVGAAVLVIAFARIPDRSLPAWAARERQVVLSSVAGTPSSILTSPTVYVAVQWTSRAWSEGKREVRATLDRPTRLLQPARALLP